ncbi:hypothetical protein ACFTTN_14135 [Streptomyces niveus]|uniref:hypothetical protein n=1 Tax=Streptomyces niveus TaxID=193462 RepID=UPI003629BE35
MRNAQITPERYGGEPLYAGLARDYSQTERPFTVTVAGPERYDGGSPTTYVLDACSTEKAWAQALAWHMAAEETPDCFVLEDGSFDGMPSGRAGIDWSDLRPEYRRQRALDGLADEATELVRAFDEATRAHMDPDGEVRQEHRPEYEQAVSQVRFDGWAMVRALSALDGRD